MHVGTDLEEGGKLRPFILLHPFNFQSNSLSLILLPRHHLILLKSEKRVYLMIRALDWPVKSGRHF